MQIRAFSVIAVLCAAVVTPLAGQQPLVPARSTPVQSVPAASAPVTFRAPAVSGPRLAPRFQPVAPRLVSGSASRTAPGGMLPGQRIAPSTLVIILAAVLVVVLVA